MASELPKGFVKALQILRYALENSMSIADSCRQSQVNIKYCSTEHDRVRAYLDKQYISKEQYDLYNTLYESLKFKKQDILEASVNNLAFEKLNKTWVTRDDQEKIEKYHYSICIRDSKPLEGSFSLKEMELIYQEYPYLNQYSVSQNFPFLTFIEFKKVLRAFNITKDRRFPLHIIENHTEEEIANFALKAKERGGYKKIVEQQASHLEQTLREAQKQLFQYKETEAWLNQLTNKVNKQKSSNARLFHYSIENGFQDETLFVAFGDIHFGKHFPFDQARFSPGVNKDILKERCLRVVEETIKYQRFHQTKDITLIFLGDLFESILPEGMHSAHLLEMDLVGDEQFLFALDVFQEMISYLLKNTPVETRIKLYSIGGNHDRIGKMRHDDRTRTATTLFFKTLEKILFHSIEKRSVEIIHTKETVLAFEQDNLSFVCYHGDNDLGKNNAVEIMNLFKSGKSENYTVLLNGHWHYHKVNQERLNFISLGVGSVCSPDSFIQNELGKGAQASFLIGKKSANYGFDFQKICL